MDGGLIKVYGMKRIMNCCIALMVMVPLSWGQGRLTVVSGIVRDADTRARLESVALSVAGSNIGTVSNADGSFVLKVPDSLGVFYVKAECLGYCSKVVQQAEFSGGRLTIWLEPSSDQLREAMVRGGDAMAIVLQAIDRIPQNYPATSALFSAFYRETIRKDRKYISVSEAMTDVLKLPYRLRMVRGERVRIVKGRRLISQSPKDTLGVKIVGGPNMPVTLDFVKNEELVIEQDFENLYECRMDGLTNLDDRLQYQISFAPKVKLDYALFKGTFYVDLETLAFSRAEFSLDLSDEEKAVKAILYKKPNGLRFKPLEETFIVDFKLSEGRSYINYLSAVTRFKCDWRRRLFSSNFTIHAEMVMVDRQDRPKDGIDLKSAFGDNDIFYDVVGNYWDPEFWAGYNIIEPTESLDKAVVKLRK